MERVPHLPVPDAIRTWFGDFTWSTAAGPFRETWCRGLVPDLEEALAQLQFLHPPNVVESLVSAGHARLAYGLRGGARSWVDEKLQLGADLAHCLGWRSRPKLIGDLRAPGGCLQARVEVGLWAGLRRVGLAPRVEQADTPNGKRADWLVACDGLDVAIELKTLSDPAYERDRTELWFAVASTIELERRGGPPVAVAFEASDRIESAMGCNHVRFCERELPRVRAGRQRSNLARSSSFRPSGESWFVRRPLSRTRMRSLPLRRPSIA